VMVGWITTVPATTVLTGSDGFRDSNEARVKTHKVTVTGRRGSTVVYTMKSSNGKDTVTDKIEVKF
jgi:hypothetical protein